jgi:glycosyltransferase involved in cell wall biosynthesis
MVDPGRAASEAIPRRRGRVLAFGLVFNEAHRVAPVLDACERLLDEGIADTFLIIDDGSTDGTAAILARHPRFAHIRHPSNRGAGASIRAAYRYALEHDFDVVTLFAMNGKDDPMQARHVLAPVLAGDADYVQGSRFLRGGASDHLPVHRRVSIHAFTLAFSALAKHRFSDCTNGFRAYRTAILRDPRVDWEQEWIGDRYELEYYIHFQVAYLGYRVVEVPVSKNYPNDNKPYSKIRPIDWLRMLRPMVYLRLGLRR